MFSKELFRRWTYQVFAPGVLLREKYNAFRELLRYDDACLELIAALEDVHYGGAAVDWTRVVHLTRRLRTSVNELVERLARLSPARHLDLPEYARKVDFYVQMALDLPSGDMSPPFVLPPLTRALPSAENTTLSPEASDRKVLCEALSRSSTGKNGEATARCIMSPNSPPSQSGPKKSSAKDLEKSGSKNGRP